MMSDADLTPTNITMAATAPHGDAKLPDAHLFSGIVKIWCVSTSPSFSMPWQKDRQQMSTSSGFIISGRRIICNAHGVKFFNNVRVRKHGDSKKYTAKVLHVGHDCDLAMLTVENDKFWENCTELQFGGIPSLQDAVICVGYPTGGDNISVTKGVVSRVDVSEYSHAGEYLLAIQIDAAINSGNSGGPALMDNQVVGVAFETLEDAENIGYVIPVPVIRHFLEDIDRNKAYTGFAVIGFSWQLIENQSLRHYLKMKPDHHGILVNKVMPLTAASKVLKPYDVLSEINGIEIADDGTIDFGGSQRISFRYLISQFFHNDEIDAIVIREGVPLKLKIKLENRRQLVPVHMYDKSPSYYVFAGLVFTVLSRPFLLHEYGKGWSKKAPIRLCEYVWYGEQTQENEEIVILNQVLVDEINVGYQEVQNTQVRAVDGVEVKNLKQLVKLVEDGRSSYVRFDLDRDKVILIERDVALEANARILEVNNIARDRSRDLLPHGANGLTIGLPGSVNPTPMSSPDSMMVRMGGYPPFPVTSPISESDMALD